MPSSAAREVRDRQARIRSMVDRYIDVVARTLRNAGVPPRDLDDEVQRTFIVAARRLEDVQVGAERKFLFQVALNVAAHTRRQIARRREVSVDQAPERIEAVATPEDLAYRRQIRDLLDGILDRMHESLRVVFTLFEFEELNTAEIAAILEIPRGTVASRLRRARREFRQQLAAIEGAWYRDAKG
jgi:RNA polymerase sigma-70 factor, ECF subfamily